MKRFFAGCMAAIMILAGASISFADTQNETYLLGEATGICLDDSGKIYVADHINNVIFTEEKVGGTLSIFAGKILPADAYGEAAGGYLDGVAANVLFDAPTDIAPYMKGYAISDTDNNMIRYIEDGNVLTLIDKTSKLKAPTSLASDEKGNLYIADTGNDRVMVLSSEGKLSAIASGLSAPRGLAWSNGCLYIADTGNQRILKYDGKSIAMVAGNTSATISDGASDVVEPGYVDGNADKARFSAPTGIAVDSKTGKLYVGDCGNNAIRVIDGSNVSTLAKADSMKLDTFPSEPVDMVISGSTLYVADADAGIVTFDLSAAAKQSADKAFTDVKSGAWYLDAVNYAYGNGLFNGTSANQFSPQANMTRGMFVTVISRLYGKTYPGEIIGGDSSFSDVPAAQYYAAPAAWAADNEIVKGIGGGNFAPNDNVTRQQMAVIVYAYAKLMGMDTAVTDEAKEAFAKMPDSAAVASWAKDALSWAVGSGVIKGKNGMLAPSDTATRAEVAQILANMAGL